MNITDLLTFLKEDIEIQKYNSLIKDKVSPEVIENLSKRMRNGRYDNIAVEILKVIQNAQLKEEQNYLRKNAGKIHGILKLMGRGNSKFNPANVLQEFRKFCYEESKGEKDLDNFWKQKYDESRAGKYMAERKNDYGIRQTKSIKLPHAFILFPRTIKKIDELGLSADDFEKQYDDIKRLAAEIAKRDTSGEVKDGERANDVHWCVASPGNEGYHYKHYKDQGGIFLVIVDKNKDGSPNWNRRYLYWIDNDGFDEFADKFDDHVPMDEVLDNDTINWLDKFKDQYVKHKGNKIDSKKIKNAVRIRAYDDIQKYQKNLKPSGNLKKIFELFAQRLKESPNKGDLKKGISLIQEKNDELATQDDLIQWFEDNGAKEHANGWVKWWRVGKKPLTIELAAYPTKDLYLTFGYYNDTQVGPVMEPVISAANMKVLKKKLLDAKEKGVFKVYDKDSWGSYTRNSEKLKQALKGWKVASSAPSSSKVYKDASSALKNNKKLLDIYNKITSEETDRRVAESLDGNFIIESDGHKGLVIRYYAPEQSRFSRGEVLGSVNDPDILDKIKEKFKQIDAYNENKDKKAVKPDKQQIEDEDLPF